MNDDLPPDIDLQDWRPESSEMSIADDEAHVWRIDLSPQSTLADIDLLSVPEHSRAAAYRFDAHRNQYINCRAALRRLLGRLTNTHPQRVSIAYAPYGKPFLPGDTFRFNVSHSENLALIAIARQFDVGIDVEVFRDAIDFPAIARRFFTPSEQALLASAPPASFADQFYQCFTRKEAWMKALGDGLTRSLEHFDVSHTLSHPIATLQSPDVSPLRTWRFIELRPTLQSIAALVTDPAIKSVKLWY